MSEKKELSAKDLKKQIWTSVFLAATALLALVAIGIAWFMNNKKVTGEGIQIQAEGVRFELATTGSATSAFDDDFNARVVGETETFGEGETKVTYYKTGNGASSISWWIDGGSNLGNNSEGAILRPGMDGQLNFSVLPLVDDLGTMSFTLEIIPYGETTKDTEGAVEIGSSYYAPLPATEFAYQLVNGHLLFFADYSNVDGYSTQLRNGEIYAEYKEGSENQGVIKNYSTDGKHRDYTIYWIWPGYFRQFVNLKESDSLFHNTTSGQEMQETFHEYMNAEGNKKYFFAQNDKTNPPEEVPEIFDAMTTANIDKCSDYYNNGDETIGSTVYYMQFILTAQEN